jgi:hypothetical protein
VPEVIDAMPVVDRWYVSEMRLGLCERKAYTAIARKYRKQISPL